MRSILILCARLLPWRVRVTDADQIAPPTYVPEFVVSEPYYNDLLRYVYRSLGDKYEAEDVVHDVFERVLALQRDGGRIEDPRALLYHAARNLMIDRHRAAKVRDHIGDDDTLLELPAAQSGEPDEMYASMQRVHLLIRAIESLPPRCRDAFVLHKIDGLPHAEVAAQMGISRNMVERHIMLAVATCRKMLGRAGKGKASAESVAADAATGDDVR